MIAIALLIIVLGVFALITNRKSKTPPDYYNLFIIGMIWFCAGVPLKNYALTILGLVFMLLGIMNKDKWKKNRRTWKNLSKKQKRIKMIVVGILTLLLLAGIIVLFLSKKVV